MNLCTKPGTHELADCLGSWGSGLECYRQEGEDDEMDATTNGIPVATRHPVLQHHGGAPQQGGHGGPVTHGGHRQQPSTCVPTSIKSTVKCNRSLVYQVLNIDFYTRLDIKYEV